MIAAEMPRGSTFLLHATDPLFSFTGGALVGSAEVEGEEEGRPSWGSDMVCGWQASRIGNNQRQARSRGPWVSCRSLPTGQSELPGLVQAQCFRKVWPLSVMADITKDQQ